MIIDINCDLGEGMENDAHIMPFITSANIACGFHAGDDNTMRSTIALAVEHHVNIGAHPSFNDRENFGRSEMELPPEKLYDLMLQQLMKIDLAAKELGASLHHVKPHGALYNMAARDASVAAAVTSAIRDFNTGLKLYGLSGSLLIREGKSLGITTVSEVFADRRYCDDGSLVPRSQEHAVIEEEEACRQQVFNLARGTVETISGAQLQLVAETICIHGDGENALVFASLVRKCLDQLQQRPN